MMIGERAPGTKTAPTSTSAIFTDTGDFVRRGKHGDEIRVDLADSLQRVEVFIEHRHMCAQAFKGARRVGTGCTGADDNHFGRWNTRDAAQQNATPAVVALHKT